MRTALACIAIMAMAILPAFALQISWDAIANYGTAMDINHNSHCTAVAWVAERHGLQKPRESDDQFISVAWVYTKKCECHKPDNPTIWRVGFGLGKMFDGRGKPRPEIDERCRYSSVASERADWDDYVAAIEADRPVIVTFCYDPATRGSLASARRRASDCFSVVGVGYMVYEGQRLLICHDGTDDPAELGKAVQDRVSPQAMGINTAGKPWGQSGTSLLKWDGEASNIVLVFPGGMP
ncbi:MAG: hypothetical protein GF393_01975 [Armatimonadia bacterium]|nr:hypothetical protein [Armatimonadia bacterium]